MATKTAPTNEELLARLRLDEHGILPYWRAQELVGRRGQRYDTRRGYLRQLCDAGHIVLVETLNEHTPWRSQYAGNTLEVNLDEGHVYMTHTGEASLDNDRRDSGDRDYVVAPDVWTNWLADREKLLQERKERYRQGRLAHAQSAAGAAERALITALGIPSPHMVSVREADISNASETWAAAKYSVTLYLTPEGLAKLTRKVSQ